MRVNSRYMPGLTVGAAVQTSQPSLQSDIEHRDSFHQLLSACSQCYPWPPPVVRYDRYRLVGISPSQAGVTRWNNLASSAYSCFRLPDSRGCIHYAYVIPDIVCTSDDGRADTLYRLPLLFIYHGIDPHRWRYRSCRSDLAVVGG